MSCPGNSGLSHHYIDGRLYFSRDDLRYHPISDLYVPASYAHGANPPHTLLGARLRAVSVERVNDEMMVHLQYEEP